MLSYLYKSLKGSLELIWAFTWAELSKRSIPVVQQVSLGTYSVSLEFIHSFIHSLVHEASTKCWVLPVNILSFAGLTIIMRPEGTRIGEMWGVERVEGEFLNWRE